MNTHIATNTQNIVYSKNIESFGTINLRHFRIEKDIELLHNWVTKSYASYWGMLGKSIEEVRLEYERLIALPYYEVFVGEFQNQSIFLMEKYKASEDRIASYYTTEETDYGMHILLAPPPLDNRIHGFTWNVFSTVLDYFFDQPEVRRVVVEPDIRNEKIHKLNIKAGFQYQKEIDLPEKKAALAFCDLKDYQEAQKQLRKKRTNRKPELIIQSNESNLSHLSPTIWKKVNRVLVCKAISEFAHELVLKPILIEDSEETNTTTNHYFLPADTPGISYQFKAQKRALDHWEIEESSIIKKQNNITDHNIDALKFIIEFRRTLGIPEHFLAVYLEEITSTLTSAAYKYRSQEFSSHSLISSPFQVIEHAMTEGHPCFVANNGRIGFDNQDYLKYAPETNTPFKILWVAGHISKTTFSSTARYNYKFLMKKELGIPTVAKFHTKLEKLGLETDSYILIPVHPWQWKNKISHVFAADIANQDLVFLGESDDEYSAQKSIRTLYNISNPKKMYTKTALSILNMGFMRGLSPYYMQSTPHITNWITDLLEKDTYLKENGFTMLGEVATVGYQNKYYEVLGKTNPHNKMLSALWRESPHCKVKSQQQLMTMAAFLHIDNDGNSFLAEMIKHSSTDIDTWIRKYLSAYLSPLIHCFFTYELVFMPHGENIIMVMQNKNPVKILMKDITEEVIVFSDTLDLPEEVKRLHAKTSDTMKVLALFTDVFDCFFRFMSSILETHLAYPENRFWELVAECIQTYQFANPQLQEKFEQYDLFVPEFDRCCLNRLQLQNTKQMLNLADPINSLILEGTLVNPIAKFKQKKEVDQISIAQN